jgi:hypothetical protein
MKDAMEAEQQEAEEEAAAGPRAVDAKGKPIFTPEEVQKKQQRQKALADKKTEARKARVEKLSENLINKVSIFAEGAKSENDKAVMTSFKEICRLEAAELVKESYGWELLQAIGRTYISKSEYVISSVVVAGRVTTDVYLCAFSGNSKPPRLLRRSVGSTAPNRTLI